MKNTLTAQNVCDSKKLKNQSVCVSIDSGTGVFDGPISQKIIDYNYPGLTDIF